MRSTIVLLLVTLLTFAAGASHAATATTATTARTWSTGELRAEFDELHTRLLAAHYDLYARRSRAEFDARFQAMRRELAGPMTLDEIRLRFQRFVAYGRVAHARIDLPSEPYQSWRQAGGKAFPLALRVVAGTTYVSENLSGLEQIAPGDTIVAFNGVAMATMLRRLTATLSADNDYMAYTMMEPRLPALVWTELGALESFRLLVRKPDGKTATVIVPARTRAEMTAAAKAQPAALEQSWDRREQRIVAGNIAYLRPGPFYNNAAEATDIWDATAFAAFIDEAFAHFRQAGCERLLIDLRDNPGGDNSFSDLMVSAFADRPYRFASDFRIRVSEAATVANAARVATSADDADAISHKLAAAYARHQPGDVFSFEIPLAQPRAGQRYSGQVFMLINRHSYSNTVLVAALAQDYGFATILGEETSDLATTFGAMEQFSLARTGITVGFPKAYIVRPSGDTRARGVLPDIAIATPVVQGTDDPVLRQALAIVANTKMKPKVREPSRP